MNKRPEIPEEKDKKQKRKIQNNNYKIPKPSVFELGNELEYRIQRLQIFMGYFVRRGRFIYTIANLDRATDLDVYALRYVEPFKREIIITECKSGDEGPLDRIFWLSGLRNYVKAKDALLVRKGTKWNIKEFAKQCNIQVIDLFRISELEKNFGINEIEWPGLSDIIFVKNEYEKWNKVLSSDSKIWELYATLSSEIHFNDPFPAINYLMYQMRLLKKMLKDIPSNSFYRYILSESISHLLIFCMCVSEKCFDLNKKDRDGFIRKGLTYGSFEPRYAERILQSAYNLTRQSVLHYTNREVEIDKSLFQMPIPPGTDEIITIVEKILTEYPLSLNLPQVCDLLISELFTKRYKAKGLLKKIYPQRLLIKNVELVRWYLDVLINSDACPSYVLESLRVENAEMEVAEQAKKKQENISSNIKNVVEKQKLFQDEKEKNYEKK